MDVKEVDRLKKRCEEIILKTLILFEEKSSLKIESISKIKEKRIVGKPILRNIEINVEF